MANRGLHRHVGQAGIGSLSEIFDADDPFTARGCIAQAWSVAEVIRATVSVAEAAARRTARRC